MLKRSHWLIGSSASGRIAGFSVVSAVLSNLASNVPAVMLQKPPAVSPGRDKFVWPSLAISGTLAGNLTLIGSAANLIVAQQAGRYVEIGFMEYFRVGALITMITTLLGIIGLFIQAQLASP